MSADRETTIRVLSEGRSHGHPRAAFSAGCLVGIVIGAASGFLVGIAAAPTIIALLERALS